MKYLQRTARLLVSVIIFAVSVGIIHPLYVGATTNGKTQSDAVNWVCARGNEGWSQDVDGAYGCQCVDLILAYYDYLLGYRQSGNAKDYIYNTPPAGWIKVDSNPQPGDVVVWGPGAGCKDGLVSASNIVCRLTVWAYWNRMAGKCQWNDLDHRDKCIPGAESGIL